MVTRSACLLSLLLTASTAHAQDAVQGWHGDLNRARKVAREQGKPLLVVFRCVR